MTEPQQLPIKKSRDLYSYAQIVENQEWIQNRICAPFSEIFFFKLKNHGWMFLDFMNLKSSSSNSLHNVKCLLHLMFYECNINKQQYLQQTAFFSFSFNLVKIQNVLLLLPLLLVYITFYNFYITNYTCTVTSNLQRNKSFNIFGVWLLQVNWGGNMDR